MESTEYDRFIINDCLWIVTGAIGVPIYDFAFRQFFNCRTPYETSVRTPGVARIGAFSDYAGFFATCGEKGIDLVHSPADYQKCTLLPVWYPLIEGHTPRSKWYEKIPAFEEIESDFELPVFIKGSRQTSKHKAGASIVRNREDFESAVAIFRSDPILHWQTFVCREFVPLRGVSGGVDGKLPASYEFRTFWWRGKLAGSGRYWYEAQPYAWTDAERVQALQVAEIAVKALNCAFLVVDLAQTQEGNWIVIECNDGMESGYAGISPIALWQNICDLENELGKSS